MRVPTHRLLATAIVAALVAADSAVYAQDGIRNILSERQIEFHGFLTQGFIKSTNGANYLTLQTSKGAWDFTDGGFNASARLTAKLHVGAQLYVRHIGRLGEAQPTLDWAVVDYRFRDYLGFRAGRVKTELGLYTSTQDLSFLHTWALLPQSLYPLDLRGLTLSHTGADLYGNVSPKRLGTFSYTAYWGYMPQDPNGGRKLGFQNYNIELTSMKGRLRGLDLKWNPPVITGLTLGTSYLDWPQTFDGMNSLTQGREFVHTAANLFVVSAKFDRGPFRLEYERNRQLSVSTISGDHGFGPFPLKLPYDSRGWYAAAAWRFKPWFEAGSYHSRYYPNSDRTPAFLPPQPPAARHIFDQAFTARFDIHNHWTVKAEGHFLDGYGDPAASRGFYFGDNPGGLPAKTQLFVIRLGFHF